MILKTLLLFCFVGAMSHAAPQVLCPWIVGAAAYYNATARVEEVGISISEEGLQIAAVLEQLTRGQVRLTPLEITSRPVSDTERIERTASVLRHLENHLPPADLSEAKAMPKAFVVDPATPTPTDTTLIRTRMKVLERRLSAALPVGPEGLVPHLLAPPLIFSGEQLGSSAAVLFYDKKHGIISYLYDPIHRLNWGALKCVLGSCIAGAALAAAANDIVTFEEAALAGTGGLIPGIAGLWDMFVGTKAMLTNLFAKDKIDITPFLIYAMRAEEGFISPGHVAWLYATDKHGWEADVFIVVDGSSTPHLVSLVSRAP